MRSVAQQIVLTECTLQCPLETHMIFHTTVRLETQIHISIGSPQGISHPTSVANVEQTSWQPWQDASHVWAHCTLWWHEAPWGRKQWRANEMYLKRCVPKEVLHQPNSSCFCGCPKGFSWCFSLVSSISMSHHFSLTNMIRLWRCKCCSGKSLFSPSLSASYVSGTASCILKWIHTKQRFCAKK